MTVDEAKKNMDLNFERRFIEPYIKIACDRILTRLMTEMPHKKKRSKPKK